MKTDPQITLRGVDDAPAIEQKVRERVLRLERYCDDIQRCQVWVEVPHGHHRQGRLHEVRIRMTVPDEELTVDDQPPEDDVNVAIRNAFDAARRQVEDYARRRRGDVKSHRSRPVAAPAAEEGK
jgi:ribosome-associated translation inhibitor RaiA